MSQQVDEADRALFADPRLLSVLSVTTVAVFTNQAAPVALPGISSSLAVTDAEIGLVMTAFFLPTTLMLLIVGSLADVYGRRRVVIPSLALFGAAGIGIFFVDSFRALLALRVIQGAAFPALTPLSTAIIGDLYEGPRGTTAQGFRSSANGVAGIAGPAVAGVLAGIAWQYPFLLALSTLPALVIVARYLPETAGAGGDAGTDRGVASNLRGVAGEYADTDFQLLAIGAATSYFTKFAVVTFIPLFAVRELGASAFIAGMLLSVRGVVRVVSAPLAGKLVAAGTRRIALVGMILLAGVSVGFMPVLPTVSGPIAPVVLLAVLMGTYSAGEALFNPVLNDSVVGIATDERRGVVVNSISVFKNGASAASPAFFGVVLTVTDFTMLFWIAALIPVVYAGSLLALFTGKTS